MADPTAEEHNADPPFHPDWNPVDITKPARQGHTCLNVKAPDPKQCPTWRNVYGPFWEDIKLPAPSGVQITYGGSNGGSRQLPDLKRQGIGIKWRSQNDSWNGLLNDQTQLHEKEFFLSQFGVVQEPTGTFKLPVMGMPPREPESEMLARIRLGDPFDVTDWFRDATVGKAAAYFHEDCVHVAESTVIITISPAYEFEIAEAEQDHKKVMNGSSRCYQNLYFIQLMPNELPSYAIFLSKNEQKLVNARINSGEYRSFSSSSHMRGDGLQFDEKDNANGQRHLLDQASQRSPVRSFRKRRSTLTSPSSFPGDSGILNNRNGLQDSVDMLC